MNYLNTCNYPYRAIPLFLFFLFISFPGLRAQPAMVWEKSYGGTQGDMAKSMERTTDGGYIIAGNTESPNDGDVSGLRGQHDFWVLKISATGMLQWQKCIGGSRSEEAFGIHQTFDGGYIAVGYTNSNDSDVAGNHGGDDMWVVKLDASGGIEWQKTMGGTLADAAYTIVQTPDSGYVVAGNGVSTDGDLAGVTCHGGADIFLFKLTQAGTIAWKKALGGAGNETAKCLRITADGGLILAGSTTSVNGDITTANRGAEDIWVVKLNATGDITWQKTFGGSAPDMVADINQANDGGYIFAATTASADSDITNNHGFNDMWIVKLTPTGNIEWQKCFGCSSNDGGASVRQTFDGGYIAGGSSGRDINGDVTQCYGTLDYWIVKLTPSGELSWQRSLGGLDPEGCSVVLQTRDSGYIAAGGGGYNSGVVTGNHGAVDVWVVRLSNYREAVKRYITTDDVKVYPTVTSGTVNIEMPPGYEDASFTVNDVMGKNIEFSISGDAQHQAVSLKNKVPGIYMLRVINNSSNLAYKIVVQ